VADDPAGAARIGFNAGVFVPDCWMEGLFSPGIGVRLGCAISESRVARD
jgi:hypothetical protein